MKISAAFLAAALLAGGFSARAQEAAAANPLLESGTIQLQPQETGDLFPAASGTTSATGTASEPAPDPTLPASKTAAARAGALQKGTAEQLRQSIRIRELKTQAQEDPQVQAAKAKPATARTEEGRRVLMRNYYTLLYTKMEQADPALQPVLEVELHDMLRRFEQHNVRPTVLVEDVAALPGSTSADHAAGEQSAASAEHSAKKKTNMR